MQRAGFRLYHSDRAQALTQQDSLPGSQAFIGAADWRGERAEVIALPQLSHFVQRALRVETGDAASAESLTVAGGRTWTAAAMQTELDSLLERFPLATALRRLRRRVMLSLVTRDATGAADLTEVMTTMTALAELAVRHAVTAATSELAQIHGVPTGAATGAPQELLVVGMGKLGGCELNVSSDIDLIFVYDEDGDTKAKASHSGTRQITNHEFFARVGRRLIALLDEVDADGRVFRVDMRLRPDGDAGPLAVSTTMLEEYLVGQGREWERFAWLKGRVVSAPVFASAEQFDLQCRALDDVVRPFVFRKYLDFGAIAALRDLHALIRAESGRRNAGRSERADNVKLGRGGIREIEFIAQTFQIIRGGRDPRLRSRSTLTMLAMLADLGVLPQLTCERLCTCYVFLRNLEHALQYVDDAQTHLVPARVEERERVARLLGAAGAEAMMGEYRAVQECVASAFDGVFGVAAGRGEEASLPTDWEQAAADDPALLEHLTELGFADAKATARRLQAVLGSRRAAASSDVARQRLERLLRRGLQAAIEHAQQGAARDIGADEHFARFAQLMEVIVGRSTYVSLLNEFPQAFERVMRMLAASRWATDYLVQHPILLDELLDERLHEREPDWQSWAATVASQLAEARDDQEAQMNVLRDAHHAQVFRLLAADLEGRLTVERLADHLSALADATLELTLQQAWRTITRRHREQPRFALIGYGKLGGKELGYASDLDLIFLYDDEHPDAADIYATLARRLVNWLSAQTSSGNLFDIDLRLRPNGNAGLMVSSFAAFARYQRNVDGLGAWTWEHQALTRARYCAGDAALGERFEQEREFVLTRERDLQRLKKDVLDMRQRMHEGHPNASDQFDLKHDHGGMVDIEFIVQYLVLAYASRHHELLRNAGNIALLQLAGGLKLIDDTLAREVANAYREFRRLQHRLRLNGAERARIERAEVARYAGAVEQLWQQVFDA